MAPQVWQKVRARWARLHRTGTRTGRGCWHVRPLYTTEHADGPSGMVRDGDPGTHHATAMSLKPTDRSHNVVFSPASHLLSCHIEPLVCHHILFHDPCFLSLPSSSVQAASSTSPAPLPQTVTALPCLLQLPSRRPPASLCHTHTVPASCLSAHTSASSPLASLRPHSQLPEITSPPPLIASNARPP